MANDTDKTEWVEKKDFDELEKNNNLQHAKLGKDVRELKQEVADLKEVITNLPETIKDIFIYSAKHNGIQEAFLQLVQNTGVVDKELDKREDEAKLERYEWWKNWFRTRIANIITGLFYTAVLGGLGYMGYAIHLIQQAG